MLAQPVIVYNHVERIHNLAQIITSLIPGQVLISPSIDRIPSSIDFNGVGDIVEGTDDKWIGR